MQLLRRRVRGRPPHPDVLTPAEWRVLERLREGESNAEIAAHLEVSVNTVRTHVSSMLAKLELRDRAQLARWDGDPASASETALRRSRPTLLAAPLGWLRESLVAVKPAVATAVVVVAGAAIVGGALVGSRMRDEQPSTGAPALPATPEATATPASTPTPTATIPGSLLDDKPTPTPLPRFTPGPGARMVVGLFSTPRATTPDARRTVHPAPPESFSPWNRTDVVLYDLQAMTERNFGTGSFPVFSRDGHWFLWVSGDVSGQPDLDQQLNALDLVTSEQRTLGPARAVVLADGSHVEVALPGTNRWERVDVLSGEREPVSGPPTSFRPPLGEAQGFRLETVPTTLPYPFAYTAYRLTDTSGRLPPLEFDAFRAALASDGTLFLVTPPIDVQPQAGDGGGSWGTSNVFEVNSVTGDATWIATAAMSPPNSPFAVSDRYVTWTENYCKTTGTAPTLQGRTRIYDRLTKTLTELDQGFFVTGFTPSGELAVGPFGADALIDARTLTYRVRFADADRAWSPDYRYAAVGTTGGHGGLCFA